MLGAEVLHGEQAHLLPSGSSQLEGMCRVTPPLPTEGVETERTEGVEKEGTEQDVGCRVAVSNYLSETGLTSRSFLEAGLERHGL